MTGRRDIQHHVIIILISIVTLSMTILSIMPFSTTFSIIMTLSIMAFSIMTIRINDIWHKNTQDKGTKLNNKKFVLSQC